MNERWRTGHKLGRTLYIGDTLIGMVDTPALAAEIVEAMNAQPDIHETDIRVDVLTSGVGIPGIVRVTHIPTGIAYECSSEKSTLQNKAEALKGLRQALAARTDGR